MNFSSKELNQYQTVAEVLSSVRKETGADLDKAERMLKISKKYLLALEAGRYDKLPSAIYVRNFTRAYAGFLGLDTRPLLEQLQKELDITEKINGNKTAAIDYQPKSRVLVTPKLIRNFLIIILILACLSYLAWEINAIFAPPALAITNPATDLTTTDNSITIEGTTQAEAQITINNQEILADQTGHFSKQLDLQTGLNTIEVKAKKKHSKESVAVRRIMVETTAPTPSVAPDQPTTGPAITVPPANTNIPTTPPPPVDKNLLNSGQ